MKMTKDDYKILDREIIKVVRNRSGKRKAIKSFRAEKTTFKVFCLMMVDAIHTMARFKRAKLIRSENLVKFKEENNQFNEMIKKYKDNHVYTALKTILKNYK